MKTVEEDLAAGRFTNAEEELIRTLKRNNWLGEKSPDKAVEKTFNPWEYDRLPEDVKKAGQKVADSTVPSTSNYVIFDDADVNIEEILLQRAGTTSPDGDRQAGSARRDQPQRRPS